MIWISWMNWTVAKRKIIFWRSWGRRRPFLEGLSWSILYCKWSGSSVWPAYCKEDGLVRHTIILTIHTEKLQFVRVVLDNFVLQIIWIIWMGQPVAKRTTICCRTWREKSLLMARLSWSILSCKWSGSSGTIIIFCKLSRSFSQKSLNLSGLSRTFCLVNDLDHLNGPACCK